MIKLRENSTKQAFDAKDKTAEALYFPADI